MMIEGNVYRQTEVGGDAVAGVVVLLLKPQSEMVE